MVFVLNVFERVLSGEKRIIVTGRKSLENFGYKGRSAKIWQFLNFTARSPNFEVKLKEVGSQNITVEANLVREFTDPKSVCIGYITSGSDEELEILRKNFQIWQEQPFLKINKEFAIAIDFDAMNDKWEKFAKAEGISLIPCQGTSSTGGRALTAQKKHVLMSACESDVYILAHARIRPARFQEEDILNHMLTAFTTPRVLYLGQPYLDLIGINSLEVLGPNTKLPFFSGYHLDGWFKLLKTKFFYIDGGISVIDARYTGRKIFNVAFAWGEAEDVEIAKNLYIKGICASLLDVAIVESLTNKRNSLSRLKYFARRALSN